MKKIFLTFSILLLAAVLIHQYRFAGPYDTFLRKEKIEKQDILDHLKKWRYHTDVWFEWVPDALTTLFKRLGIGGWTETGERICVQGCAYWTEKWTDGFYSVDLELQQISFSDGSLVTFTDPYFLDIEIWGKIRTQIEKERGLPKTGDHVNICGPLRMDRPYFVFTVQPDRMEEIQKIGSCKPLPKENPSVLKNLSEASCEKIGAMNPFHQIALLDSLSLEKESGEKVKQIEKAAQCMSPTVLKALSSNGDVYEILLKSAPSIGARLFPLEQKLEEREGNPVRNTISDLIRHFFKSKSQRTERIEL